MKFEGNMEYFTQRLKCSYNEKTACLEIVRRLYRYGMLARRSGLLSLEREINDESDFLLKKGLRLVVDALNPDRINDMTLGYLLSGNYKGEEFLKKMLVMEGLRMIQDSVNPKFMLDLLGAWFGEEFAMIYEDEMDLFLEEELKNSQVRKAIEDYIGHGNFSVVSDFDRLTSLDLNGILKLVQSIEVSDLALAMKGASNRVAWRLFESLSFRRQDLLISELVYLDEAKEEAIRSAQKKILNIVNQLQQAGEVILLDESKKT